MIPLTSEMDCQMRTTVVLVLLVTASIRLKYLRGKAHDPSLLIRDVRGTGYFAFLRHWQILLVFQRDPG